MDWDGDGTFANSESDVTSRIRTLPACKRGRDFSSNFFGQSGAGVLTMQLWDEDHLYDRFNTNSSLHDLVIPGLGVRVSMLSEGSYEFEWGGLLDSVKPRELSGRRLVNMRALGAISLLRNRPVDVGVQADISVADAAAEVVQVADIPSAYVGTLAGPTVMPYWLVDNQRSLQSLRDLEETELGFLKEDRLGRIALEAHTDRSRTGQPVITFASPEVRANMSEVQLTKLTWEDPIKDIASRVAIPVRIFSLDAFPTGLWGPHHPYQAFRPMGLPR